MFGIDAIISLAGLVLPPAVDFIKKKFLKAEVDTPEQTMSTLATTKPDVLPEYVKAQVEYLKAQVDFFNRDVTGTPSQWVVDLRAAIRPIGVVASMILLSLMVFGVKNALGLSAETVTGVRLTCELIVASWFGTRISMSLK